MNQKDNPNRDSSHNAYQQNSNSGNPPDDVQYMVSAYPQDEMDNASLRWLWLVPLLLIVLGSGLLAGRFWGQKEANKAATLEVDGKSIDVQATDDTQSAKPVMTVEAIYPKKAFVNNTLSADGTIVAKDIANVSGKVNGVSLEQVFVKAGDWVKQGQVLAVFDTSTMEQQVIQAQADLAEAETRLKLAQNDAERVLPLVEIDAVSRQEADRYMANANQAQASVVAAQARLNSQGLNLENAKVIAPVSGIISENNANVGSVNGQAPLFTIIKDGVLEWQAQIDPSRLNAVQVGTPVQVSLPDNNSVIGQVIRIAPTAEQGSRQVSVYAALNPTPLARAGMYQRGTFILGEEDRQILPVSAIVSQDGYDYVMLVERQRGNRGETLYKVKREKVNLGERQGSDVVIANPLPSNAAVVRQGGSFLEDGDVVRLAENRRVPLSPLQRVR